MDDGGDSLWINTRRGTFWMIVEFEAYGAVAGKSLPRKTEIQPLVQWVEPEDWTSLSLTRAEITKPVFLPTPQQNCGSSCACYATLLRFHSRPLSRFRALDIRVGASPISRRFPIRPFVGASCLGRLSLRCFIGCIEYFPDCCREKSAFETEELPSENPSGPAFCLELPSISAAGRLSRGSSKDTSLQILLLKQLVKGPSLQ